MAELRVYVTKGPTRPWEELKPGDNAQSFPGLYAARDTVRAAAWETVRRQPGAEADWHGTAFIGELRGGDVSMPICRLLYDHDNGRVDDDPDFQLPTAAEVVGRLDDAAGESGSLWKALVAEPRLHVFLTSPARNEAGAHTGLVRWNPLTDTRPVRPHEGLPALTGLPYRGLEQAVAVLDTYVNDPPATIAADDLPYCQWEAWVSMGHVPAAGGDGIEQPARQMVAIGKFDPGKGRHEVAALPRASNCHFVVSEVPGTGNVADIHLKGEDSIESTAWQAFHLTTYGHEGRAVVYDLNNGRYVRVADIMALHEPDPDQTDKVRTAALRDTPPPKGHY